MAKEESKKVSSARWPTHRQREFALAYLLTGCAARAAREAGYKGRYAAQAGYKLLNRPGTIERILYWQRFERLVLRAAVLRVLSRVRRTLECSEHPDGTGEAVVALASRLGLWGDPAVQALQRRLSIRRPVWRRLVLRPWEDAPPEALTRMPSRGA